MVLRAVLSEKYAVDKSRRWRRSATAVLCPRGAVGFAPLHISACSASEYLLAFDKHVSELSVAVNYGEVCSLADFNRARL